MDKFQPITIDFLGGQSFTIPFGQATIASLFVLIKSNKAIKASITIIPRSERFWTDAGESVYLFEFANEPYEKFKDRVHQTINKDDFNGSYQVLRYDITCPVLIAPLLRWCPLRLFEKVLVRDFNRTLRRQLESNGIQPCDEIRAYSKLKESLSQVTAVEAEQIVEELKANKSHQPLPDIRNCLKTYVDENPINEQKKSSGFRYKI